MPDEPNRPLKVFLCHAHSDAQPVRALYARLKADGVDAWLDKENIIAGQDWDFEIRKAVRESDIVVVCLSQQFSQKGYRQNEVRVALEEAKLQPEGEIFIIPARLEECDYLESLRRFHGVDLFEERGYDYLMRALRLRADKIGAVVQSQKGWLNRFTSPVKQPVHKKPEPLVKKPVSQTEKPAPRVTKKSPRKLNTQIIIAIVGAVATVLAAILGSLPWKDLFPAAPVVTVTNTATFTPHPPTLTFTPALPTKTNTPVFTPTPTPVPDEFTDANNIKMRLVPAGTFMMGSDNGEANEKPVHEVYLDDYYMDVYEVTNSAYKLCVGDGTCKSPADTSKYNASQYADHPVVYVDWNMAKTYCAWRGARLPSEAEWEKAARGTDGRTYPWGEDISCDQANYYGCKVKNDTTAVGSYESGKSPYGMYDMAGNVFEWVNDWYGETYYQGSPSSNPLGPDSGQYQVLRGGSWSSFDYVVRSANRNWDNPSFTFNLNGFRCSRSLPVP